MKKGGLSKLKIILIAVGVALFILFVVFPAIFVLGIFGVFNTQAYKLVIVQEIIETPVRNSEGLITNIDLTFVFDPSTPVPDGEFNAQCRFRTFDSYEVFNTQHNKTIVALAAGSCRTPSNAKDNRLTFHIYQSRNIERYELDGPYLFLPSGFYDFTSSEATSVYYGFEYAPELQNEELCKRNYEDLKERGAFEVPDFYKEGPLKNDNVGYDLCGKTEKDGTPPGNRLPYETEAYSHEEFAKQ
jgi:hypothetical protein